MNEIQLSDSLPVIETEIRQYQNLAGESIFEIGRRLKHVKENDLAHGEFGKWLESINLDRTQAHRFIKVSEEIKDVGTYQHLGLRALSEIATLPEPERTKEHTTSKGETKTPDEMTVKELRELRKQLKQRDEENNLLQSKLEDAENREPETITKEIIPKHIKVQLSDKENELLENRRRTAQLEKELNQLKTNKLKPADSDDDEIGSRRFQAESNVLDLRDNINQFLKENSVNAFREGAIAASSQRTKDSLLQGVEELEAFCRSMRTSLNNRITIN